MAVKVAVIALRVTLQVDVFPLVVPGFVPPQVAPVGALARRLVAPAQVLTVTHLPAVGTWFFAEHPA